MKDEIDVSASKYDVEDITHYDYLQPIWELLRNTPDQGITSKELWEKTGLDPEIGNPLMKKMQLEFQNKLLKNIMGLLVNKKQIVNSWTFDKIMLLVTKINTEGNVPFPDTPVFNMWMDEWKKKQGV